MGQRLPSELRPFLLSLRLTPQSLIFNESKRAEAILPHVEELARCFDAKVIFLQILEDAMVLGYDEVVDISTYQKGRDQRRKEAESYLAGLEGAFKEKKISVQKIVSSYGSVV